MSLALRGGLSHGFLSHWGSLRSETHITGEGGGCPKGILEPELGIPTSKSQCQWPYGIIEFSFPESGHPDCAGTHLPEPQAKAGERPRAGEVPAAGR